VPQERGLIISPNLVKIRWPGTELNRRRQPVQGDLGRLSARLGATYNSTSIYQHQWEQCTPAQAAAGGCEDPSSLGPKGPVGDNYLYAHLQVDAQASFRVQRTLTVLWQGLNLTDQVFGIYNGSPWYVTQREYYRPTYSFGLRWEPRRE